MTAMNVFGSIIATRAVADMLEDEGAYGPTTRLVTKLAYDDIWPIELCVASIIIAQLLLRAGRLMPRRFPPLHCSAKRS